MNFSSNLNCNLSDNKVAYCSHNNNTTYYANTEVNNDIYHQFHLDGSNSLESLENLEILATKPKQLPFDNSRTSFPIGINCFPVVDDSLNNFNNPFYREMFAKCRVNTTKETCNYQFTDTSSNQLKGFCSYFDFNKLQQLSYLNNRTSFTSELVPLYARLNAVESWTTPNSGKNLSVYGDNVIQAAWDVSQYYCETYSSQNSSCDWKSRPGLETSIVPIISEIYNETLCTNNRKKKQYLKGSNQVIFDKNMKGIPPGSENDKSNYKKLSFWPSNRIKTTSPMLARMATLGGPWPPDGDATFGTPLIVAYIEGNTIFTLPPNQLLTFTTNTPDNYTPGTIVYAGGGADHYGVVVTAEQGQVQYAPYQTLTVAEQDTAQAAAEEAAAAQAAAAEAAAAQAAAAEAAAAQAAAAQAMAAYEAAAKAAGGADVLVDNLVNEVIFNNLEGDALQLLPLRDCRTPLQLAENAAIAQAAFPVGAGAPSAWWGLEEVMKAGSALGSINTEVHTEGGYVHIPNNDLRR